VAAQLAGNLVGVLLFFIGAGQQDLATTQGEGIWRTQTRLQGLALGVAQRTREDGLFHVERINHCLLPYLSMH
jgi:hypothetical protein